MEEEVQALQTGSPCLFTGGCGQGYLVSEAEGAETSIGTGAAAPEQLEGLLPARAVQVGGTTCRVRALQWGGGRRAAWAADDEQRNGQGRGFCSALRQPAAWPCCGEGLGSERQCWPAWLEPWLCLFPAVRPQASFLSSLVLSFHICKVGVITALAHHRTAWRELHESKNMALCSWPGGEVISVSH